MSDINSVLHALGRIEGKLDTEIKLAEEHRTDDKRRFTELHVKVDENKDAANATFAKHAEDINKAKGATKLLAWLLAGGAAGVATLVYAMANGFPHK